MGKRDVGARGVGFFAAQVAKPAEGGCGSSARSAFGSSGPAASGLVSARNFGGKRADHVYFTPEHEATHKAPLAPVWLKAATGHAAFPRDDLTRICEGYKLDMVWASAPG